jgi:hypothetical protein
VQAAGGVDEDGVDAVGLALRDGVEGDARRVAALGAADGLRADPVAPGLQLVGGRGAEGVGGAEHDRPAVGDEHAGELAAGGRLAGAVDADDEHDGGRAVLVRQGAQERSTSAPMARTSSSRSSGRSSLMLRTPSTRTRVRRRVTSSVVAATPMSADSSVSSTSSQVSSSRTSRESRVNRPRPRTVCDRDSRARRRCRRPAVGSGTSRTGPTTCVSLSSSVASSGRSTTSTVRSGVSRGTSASSPVPGR